MSVPGASVTETIPPEIAALAAAEGFGSHVRTFRPQRTAVWRLVGQAVFGVAGLVIVFPAVMFGWLLMQSPNLSKKQAARRLHFFEHGLIVTDRKGRAGTIRFGASAVMQEVVRRYVNGVYVGTTYTYTLIGPAGAPVKVTNFFEQPELWGPAIQQAITEAQLPGALAALRAGETIDFGDIVVNAAGVATARRGSTTWAEIQAVEVRKGWVYLRKAGKTLSWSSTPVKKIPNAFLFLAITNVLTENARQGAPLAG